MDVFVGEAKGLPIGQRDFFLEVLRQWCLTRREVRPVQPQLVQILAPFTCELLAPVLDALFQTFEACLGRPMVSGHEKAMTADELDLVALLNGSLSSSSRFPQSRTEVILQVALCSTQVMVVMSRHPKGRSRGKTARN